MSQIDILNSIHDSMDSVLMDDVSLVFNYLFFDGLIWFLVAILFLRKPNCRVIGATLFLAMIMQTVVVYAMKFMVDEPRPFDEYEVDALITSFSTSSFPSGHAASCFCAATVIAAFDRRKGLLLFLLAILVSVTRLYMYAHYPSDVIGGALIGFACAAFILFTFLRSERMTVFVREEES